jgi:hypothetical protein
MASVWLVGLALVVLGNVRVKEKCPLLPAGALELQDTRGGLCYDGFTLDGQCHPRHYTQPCAATDCFLAEGQWWCPVGTKGTYSYIQFWGHNCTGGDTGYATCPRFDNQYCEWAQECGACTPGEPKWKCKGTSNFGDGDLIWYVWPTGYNYECPQGIAQIRGDHGDFALAQANGVGYNVFGM